MLKELDEDVWLTRALPIVISVRKPGIGAGNLVIGLYRDRLVVAQLRRNQDKPEAIFQLDGAQALLEINSAGKPEAAILSDVMSAVVQPKSKNFVLAADPDPPIAVFVIKSKTGTIKFEVPATNVGFLVQGMHFLLGNRFSWPDPPPEWITELRVGASGQSAASTSQGAPRKVSSTVYREPYRNPRLGALLMVLGAPAFLAAVICVLAGDLGMGTPDFGTRFLLTYGSLVGVALAGAAFRVGQRMLMPRVSATLFGDLRPPILYLRSFGNENIMSPLTRVSLWGLPLWFLGVPGILLHFILHSLLRYGRLEEKLARFFKARGPIVAVGKPGERFSTLGFARVYLADDAWQEFVLTTARRSQIVLLQIAPTEGTWWEFEQCVDKLDPTRLLLLLGAIAGRANMYDRLRIQAQDVLPLPLPRTMDMAMFVRFDADWTPHMMEAVYTKGLSGVLHSFEIDLQKSLQPFLERLPQEPPVSLPAQREEPQSW